MRRISKLEQKERSNIATFSAKHPGNTLVDAILDYYQTADEKLLFRMERTEVEEILKSVKSDSNKKAPPKNRKSEGASPTVGGAQLIFNENDALIDEILETAKEDVDGREDTDKRATVQIQVGELKLGFPLMLIHKQSSIEQTQRICSEKGTCLCKPIVICCAYRAFILVKRN